MQHPVPHMTTGMNMNLRKLGWILATATMVLAAPPPILAQNAPLVRADGT